MSKRILSPEQKEKNRIKARKYYNEHKEKCNEYERKRRLEIKNDPILNQQMKDYKREWTRNKRKKDKENAELVIKQKEVLDKIKEHLLNYIEEWQDSEDEYVKGKIDLARDVLCDIEELLEEIKWK